MRHLAALSAAVVFAGCLAAPWIQAPRFLLQGITVLVLWPLWRLRGHPAFLPIFLVSLFALTAAAWKLDRTWAVNSVHAWRSTERINVTGWVSGPPELESSGNRQRVSFALEAKSVIFFDGDIKREVPVQGRVWVKIYQCGRIPSYGDSVRVSGELSEPQGRRNPHGFDERRWLSDQGFDSVLKAYGLKAMVVTGEASEANRLLKGLFEFRALTSKKIGEVWSAHEALYFKALILGERQSLPASEKETFIRTATAHILSISGLHFALIAGTLFILLLSAGVRPKAAAWLSFFLLFAYVFLAGFSVPVRRAGFMAAAGMGALILERETRSFHVLFLAVVFFLLADTRLLGNVSFQLSFLSVFCMLWAVRKAERQGAIPGAVQVSLAVTAGTFPVIAAVFHGVSLTGIPANLIAVPLFNAALLFSFPALFFYGVKAVLLGQAAASLAAFFLKAGLASAAWFSALPGSYLFVPEPSKAALFTYSFFCAAFAFLDPKRSKNQKRLKRLCGAGCAAAALVILFPGSSAKPFAAVLQAKTQPLVHVHFDKNQDWVFASPGGYWNQDDTWVLRPYLQGEGCRKLERIVLLSERKKKKSAPRPATLFPMTGKSSSGSRYFETFPPELKGGRRVVFAAGDRGFDVLENTNQRPPVRLWIEGMQILLMPALNAESTQKVLGLEEWGADSQVLVLPALTDSNRGTLAALLEKVDPQMLVLPKPPNEAILSSLPKIPKICFLNQRGAIRFDAFQKGNP